MTAAPPEPTQPIRTGVFVAVVGPSGAGKDTLIDWAREALTGEDRVEFVRRVITRPCDGMTEDHDSLDDAAFQQALGGGAFALAWEAHGLRYGLPASVDDTLAAGRVAVANLSRGAIAALARRYANLTVVEITAPAEILSARLAARGREAGGDVLARLDRSVKREAAGPAAIVIDNGGDRHTAGEQLVAIIRKALAESASPKPPEPPAL